MCPDLTEPGEGPSRTSGQGERGNASLSGRGRVSWHGGNEAESKCIFDDISLHAASLLQSQV